MLKLDILTLFPEMFASYIDTSIVKRAISNGVIKINFTNFRHFSNDKHGRVDDKPSGGGAGLVLRLQPIIDALNAVKKENTHVILTDPAGSIFNQKKAHELSKKEHLIIICGHYEGFDERIHDYVDESLSIGDYILIGGELSAMVISEAVVRLVNGTISKQSIIEESFENGLLEYPQYTVPQTFDNKVIPEVLLGGNHELIRRWRLLKSLHKTKERRPDLLVSRQLTAEEKELLAVSEAEFIKRNFIEIEKAKKFLKR